MAKCLQLAHTPPDNMFPADESYCNVAHPGALLAHLVLGTWEVNFPPGYSNLPTQSGHLAVKSASLLYLVS